MAIGKLPQTPHSLSAAFEENNLGACHLSKGWEEQLYTAKCNFDNESKKIKKFTDRKHRLINNKEGEMVLVKLNPRKFKVLSGVHQNIVCQNEGLFMIAAKVGKISFKL